MDPVTARRQFGVSTHLFRGQRLCRDHLLAVGSHGFDTVEMRAAAGHFDYGNVTAVADLQQWLAEAGLTLQSVYAPEPDLGVLHVARRIAVPVLIVPIGSQRGAARRMVDELARAARPLGVRIAVEGAPNEPSTASSLVHFVEHDVEGLNVGICLDLGRAQMNGDVGDAIETVAEHLVAIHLHDARGRSDEHLIPLEGDIDWPSAMTAIQKVGYDGPLMFDIASRGSAKDALARARAAREQLERMLDWD